MIIYVIFEDTGYMKDPICFFLKEEAAAKYCIGKTDHSWEEVKHAYIEGDEPC